ncbi:MAG: MFS transporter [Planctomycetes bacterium]|nr:MFS transporter [Planctomycetota bacterium]
MASLDPTPDTAPGHAAESGPDILDAPPRLLLAMVAMGLLYTWAFFQRVAIPGTIFDELQGDLAMSGVQVTRLGTIYLAIYAPMQLISGFLADRFGGARVLTAGGVLLTIGATAFPLSHSIGSLYLSEAFIGLGASVMFICAAREISDLFGDRGFTYLLGPLLCMGGVGAMLATAPFQRAAHFAGWRTPLLAVGGLTAASLVAFVLLVRGTRQAHKPAASFRFADLMTVVTNPLTIPGLIVGPFSFTVYLILQATIGKKCLQDLAAMPPDTASNITFTMSVISMSIALAGGFVSRVARHRRKPAIFVFAALTITSCALLLAGVKLGATGACLAAAYILLACANGLAPILSCSFKELSPPRHIGLAIGFGNMVTYLCVSVANDLVGRVLDHYTPAIAVTAATPLSRSAIVYPPAAYATIFAGCMALALGCAAAACFVKETNGRMYLKEPGER